MVLSVLTTILAALAPLAAAAPEDPAVERERLEALVRGLCTSETVGRETTTEGYRTAAELVAAELERTGVRPGGEDGFFQRVPLQRWSVATLEGAEAPLPPTMEFVDVDGASHTFVCGIDFDLYSQATSAPPPSKSYEVVVVRTPEELPDEADADGALMFLAGVPRNEREALLASKGQEFGDWGLVIEPRSNRPGPEATVPEPVLALDRGEDEPGNIVLVRAGAKRLLVDGRVRSLRLDVPWKREALECVNVVGVVPGVGTADDPSLAEDVVVLTANLDHKGVGPREVWGNRDRTFDGADNNATGVAALLEVAEALAADPPARTTVFLFATGDEQGHLGVQQQLRFPARPLEQTLVTIEVFALGHADPQVAAPGGLWCTNFMETSVGAGLQSADLPITMDRRPRWNMAYDSSSWRYTQAGIVGHRLSSFSGKDHVGTPADEPDLVDYAHLERATETLVGVARALAEGEVEIEAY